MKQLSTYITIYLLQLLCLVSCKDTNIENDEIASNISFKYEDYIKGIKLSQNITEINFIELNKTFAPSILPSIVKCRIDKYFMLWRYNKINIYSKTGIILDSIVSYQNTPNYIGNIFDFEVSLDSLFVLTGDRIYVYPNNNLNIYTRKIELPSFYNTFSIYNNGFLLYSATETFFLSTVNKTGNLSEQHFKTEGWPVLRGDLFPHFVYHNKNILFFHPYNPTIYNVDNITGSIQKVLTVDMGPYALTPEERSSLMNDPKNHANEMNIVNKKYGSSQ